MLASLYVSLHFTLCGLEKNKEKETVIQSDQRNLCDKEFPDDHQLLINAEWAQFPTYPPFLSAPEGDTTLP